jgi:acylphosphatase
MPGWRAVVRGRVQGVGFRAYVQDEARALLIQGEVWNRTDGSVELTFSHPEAEILQELVDLLHQGPGRVDGVQVLHSNELTSPGLFRIGLTRP